MKYSPIFALLIFSSIMIAQEPKDSVEVNTFNSSLQKGELFHFGDKSIKFLDVISDSRCPIDVSCVWAGEAKLLIGIFEDGKLLKEMIVSHSSTNAPYNIPLNISAKGIAYFISGLELYPYPTTRVKISEGEYSLQILVKEKI